MSPEPPQARARPHDRDGLTFGLTTVSIAVGAAAVLMLVLDLAFLGIIAKPFYDDALGHLRADPVNWTAALLFYGFYVLTIVVVAVLPVHASSHAARRGAGLGLFAYGVYELTNWAVIAGWPARLVPFDIMWGVALTGTVAGLTHRVIATRIPSFDGWMTPFPLERLAGESWLKVWARRTISIPLIALLLGFVLATAPCWIVLSTAWDLVAGPRGLWTKSRAGIFFAWYLLCEAAGLLGAGAIWTFTLGGMLVSRQCYVEYNVALQRRWTDALLFGSIRIFAMHLEVEGEAEGKEGPFLTWVRHVSTADSVLTAAVLANPYGIHLRYVLKEGLLWDPCLDVVGRRLPNAFIRRGATDSGPAIAAVAQLAQNLDDRSAVLIYPEGTRFSAMRRTKSLAHLERRGDTELLRLAKDMQHTLPPRLGGVLALLDEAPGIDVVTVAHTGLEGARTFGEFWSGGLIGSTIRVSIRRCSATNVPPEERPRWVYERWREVDNWVGAAKGR